MIKDLKIRNCPSCTSRIEYSSKYECNRANSKNSICSKCRYKNLGKRNKNNCQLNKKDKEEILELVMQKNLSYKEIGEMFNVSDATVSRLARLNGVIKFNPKKIKLIDEKYAKCSKCSLVLDISLFKKTRTGGCLSFCYKCEYINFINKINIDIKNFFTEKVRKLRVKCKKEKIQFSLTVNDLLDAYNSQKGRCFYTNEKMLTTLGCGNNRYQLSVDRIVPSIGYTKHNIVLCIHIINNVKTDLSLEELKKWIPKWYKKLIKVAKTNQRL